MKNQMDMVFYIILIQMIMMVDGKVIVHVSLQNL